MRPTNPPLCGFILHSGGFLLFRYGIFHTAILLQYDPAPLL